MALAFIGVIEVSKLKVRELIFNGEQICFEVFYLKPYWLILRLMEHIGSFQSWVVI